MLVQMRAARQAHLALRVAYEQLTLTKCEPKRRLGASVRRLVRGTVRHPERLRASVALVYYRHVPCYLPLSEHQRSEKEVLDGCRHELLYAVWKRAGRDQHDWQSRWFDPGCHGFHTKPPFV